MAGKYMDDHNVSVQKEDGEVHYTKPLSTDPLVLTRSAHLGVTKQSMHIEDCVRIIDMDNCSKLRK